MKSIRIILQFLKKHLTLTLLAPLCVIIEVTAELVQPKIMSEIVNRGVIGAQLKVGKYSPGKMATGSKDPFSAKTFAEKNDTRNVTI